MNGRRRGTFGRKRFALALSSRRRETWTRVGAIAKSLIVIGGRQMVMWSRCVLGAVAALALCAGTSPASAGQLYNTGVDDAGNTLSDGTIDPHYTVNGGSSVYVVGGSQFPMNGFWLPQDDPSTVAPSAWVSPSGHASADPTSNGFYDYQTTFTLDPSTDLATTFIFGQWAADGCGTDIVLNGHSTNNGMDPALCAGSGGNTAFNQFTQFEIDPGYFQIGTNTLDFLVENFAQEENNPTGVRVDAAVVPVVVAVPEPITVSLFGAGLLGAGMIRRRRTKAA
jgi:hypothetical protein